MKFAYASIFGVMFTILFACSTSTSANTNKTTKSDMSRLDKETKSLIGSASCTSDNQCHSIGFGHKPCGGFYAYRIYSDQNTDTAQLIHSVNKYNALSREQNKNNNLVSNCMMLMQPQLSCQNQTCQIKRFSIN